MAHPRDPRRQCTPHDPRFHTRTLSHPTQRRATARPAHNANPQGRRVTTPLAHLAHLPHLSHGRGSQRGRPTQRLPHSHRSPHSHHSPPPDAPPLAPYYFLLPLALASVPIFNIPVPTPTVENYVKTLYTEQQRAPGERLGLGKYAQAMGVVPGTLTTMARTLADAGLVHYEPRVGLSLTPEGEKLALHVLRRHRLVELFLVRVLKFDWSEVHDEAEELEHAISDKLLEKMDAYLDYPAVDPHGDPIPTATGQITVPPDVPLSDCSAGQRVRVTRIENQDADFLVYAHESGLTPGSMLQVTTHDRYAQAVILRKSDGTPLALGTQAAGAVRVVVL